MLFCSLLFGLLIYCCFGSPSPRAGRWSQRPTADEARGRRGPRQMRLVATGAKGMSPFCFFVVCFLVLSFTAVLVLFLLEQDDGPSVPRRTRPAADEARAGRGPRGTRPGKRSPQRTRPQQTRLQQTWGLRPSKQARRRQTRRDVGRETTRRAQGAHTGSVPCPTALATVDRVGWHPRGQPLVRGG